MWLYFIYFLTHAYWVSNWTVRNWQTIIKFQLFRWTWMYYQQTMRWCHWAVDHMHTMATFVGRVASTRQDRSCSIHALPRNALGSTSWVIGGLYAACYSIRPTNAQHGLCVYYVIIHWCQIIMLLFRLRVGVDLTRLAWVCNPVKKTLWVAE